MELFFFSILIIVSVFTVSCLVKIMQYNMVYLSMSIGRIRLVLYYILKLNQIYCRLITLHHVGFLVYAQYYVGIKIFFI